LRAGHKTIQERDADWLDRSAKPEVGTHIDVKNRAFWPPRKAVCG
jgi:hypothetical protein